MKSLKSFKFRGLPGAFSIVDKFFLTQEFYMTLVNSSFRNFVFVALIGLFLFPAIAFGQETETETSGFKFIVPPQPEWPVSEWDVGTSVTYRVNVTQPSGSTEMSIRLAVLGTEEVVGETLYWLEIDITDISGIPPDLQSFFIDNYGEIPNSIRLKLELPQQNLMDIILDPTGFYYDISSPGFIESTIFQYNRQVPWDVDPTLVSGWVLPVGATLLLEGNLPDDFYDTRNIGFEIIEDGEMYTSEVSETEITVTTGSYDCTHFAYTATGDVGWNGSIYFTGELPIFPVLLLESNWAGTMNGTMSVELIDIAFSGVESQIVGEPAPFNLQTLMMMGM